MCVPLARSALGSRGAQFRHLARIAEVPAIGCPPELRSDSPCRDSGDSPSGASCGCGRRRCLDCLSRGTSPSRHLRCPVGGGSWVEGSPDSGGSRGSGRRPRGDHDPREQRSRVTRSNRVDPVRSSMEQPLRRLVHGPQRVRSGNAGHAGVAGEGQQLSLGSAFPVGDVSGSKEVTGTAVTSGVYWTRWMPTATEPSPVGRLPSNYATCN